MAKKRNIKKRVQKKVVAPIESSSSSSYASQDDVSSSGDDSSSSSNNNNDNNNKVVLSKLSTTTTTRKQQQQQGFTDDNADWLKPKQKDKKSENLLSSDSDDDSDDDDDDDDDDDEGMYDNEGNVRQGLLDDSDSNEEENDDDNDDDELDIERQSRLLDAKERIEAEEAEEELRHTIDQHTSIFHLPTPSEIEEEVDRVVPPSELNERIDSILEVLSDFKRRRETNRSRSDYLDVLTNDISELFGYLPELVAYFLSMFGPTETLEFIQAQESPRPLVIRTNTLKVRRKDLAASLLKRGVTLDPLATWSKVGLKILESPVPIGATPEYLSGHYMLQSAASMCPVMALGPSPNQKVLDMSAAPGGKTTYLSQLMRNTGTIIANDLRPDRQKATVANIHRLGCRNVISSTHDGRKLGKLWKNRFDKILLDAPCSGLGVISRDPSVKVQRTMKDIERCGVLQKELLLSAVDALNYKGSGGGIMVYSTCSVSVAENEEVVNYLLNNRDVKLMHTGLDFGKPGFTRYLERRFHPSLTKTRRFYPHVHNMDGFYVAKIQKFSDKRPGDIDEPKKKKKDDAKTTNKDGEDVIVKDGEEVNVEDDAMEVDDSVEETKEKAHNEVDWESKVKESVAASEKSSNGDVGTSPRQKGKKKKSNDDSKNDESEKKGLKKERGAMSRPPSTLLSQQNNKRKKKTTNAKMTKPRRQKT